MNRFLNLMEELQVVTRPAKLAKAQSNGSAKQKVLEKARKDAQFRVQRAFLKINGTHPTHGKRRQQEGLRLAKKLIDHKIKDINIVVDTLRRMHTVLSSKRRFTQQYDPSYCKTWGAYYNKQDRLIHLCPKFFQKSQEEQIRTLIHESAHAAGIGESKGESYLAIYDCQTSFNDINVADGWAHYVHCILGLPLDQPDTVTAQSMNSNGHPADRTAVIPDIIKTSDGDPFIAVVLNFIFEGHLTAENLNDTLRDIAAKALWELIEAANLQQYFPKPPRDLPSPSWLIMEETQTAFQKNYREHKFPETIRKTIGQKWKKAYELAKMELAKGMTSQFTADKLTWPGASQDQLAFMRKIYNINYKRSSGIRNQVGDVPANELEEVESGRKLRKGAAQAFKTLLKAAREDIQKAGVKVNIGISSAYRSPSSQFQLWQQNFRDYYQRTKADRQNMDGGEHGDKAAQHLAAYTRKRIAMPGFSNHNDGLAVDVKNVEDGTLIQNSTKSGPIAKWKASWLWDWLVKNAGTYGFQQQAGINEPWHWVYTNTSGSQSYYHRGGSIDAVATQLCYQFSRSEILSLVDAINGWVEQNTLSTVSFRGSVGAGGTNNPGDVKILKKRLYSLGFDWIGANSQVNNETIQAIKLFQSIIAGKERISGDGKIDVTGTHTPTLDWLSASNAPKWKQLPSSGKGYQDTDKAASNVNDGKVSMNWGTDWLIDTIIGAGRHYEDNYRKGNKNIQEIFTNDLSLKRGGDTKDHKGHETGLMVDLRLPRKHPHTGIGGIRWDSPYNVYDQDAARAIIKAFRAQPLFEVCYFNDPKLIAEGLCKKLSKHDDHIHIKVKPPVRK